MKRTNIFLPEQTSVSLRAIADKTGLSVAEHIRRAIDQYLHRQQVMTAGDVLLDYKRQIKEYATAAKKKV